MNRTGVNPSTIDSYSMALKQLPVAGCLLSDTPERVVLLANERFYQLIGCSQSEFQYRFGGRLSAITIGKWPDFIFREEGESIEMEQQLRSEEDGNCWIRICARYIIADTKRMLYCVLTDISAEKNAIKDYRNYHSIFNRASQLDGSETFEYDIVTQRAEIYSEGNILEQITQEEQEHFGSFQQAFLEKRMLNQEDEEAFLNAFAAIQRKEAAVCEVRIYTSQGQQQWVRLLIEMKEMGYDGCTKAIGILRNMTELKAANLQCLGEAQFLQALLSEKDAYIQVDVSTDRMLRVGGQWFLYSGLIHSISYSSLLNDYLSKTIYQEDYNYYKEFMRSDNLIRSYENGIDRLSCRVRRVFEQEQVRWIEIDAFLFQNPFSQSIEALVYSIQLDKMNTWTSVPGIGDVDLLPEGAEDEVLQIEDTEFEHFLSANGDMAYLVDMNSFELLAGNAALYQRVELTKDECAGKPCYWVMHHRNSPCPFCGRANWSRDKFYTWKNWNTEFQQDFLIKNKIVNWHGKEVLLAIAVDVSQNNSLFDSLEDGGSESHSMLAGIQKMAEARTFTESAQSSLETIGSFFSAGAVQYWEYRQQEDIFVCGYQWKQDSTFLSDPEEERVSKAVNQWVHKLRWTYPVVIENQEAMLCYSFDMYELLKESGIWNQRWVPLRENDQLWGIFVITNISNHFKNNSFMDTFTTFILEEWRNQKQLDDMLFASSHDELTGLGNRKGLKQYQKAYSPDDVKSLGVVSVNLNNLEMINTQQGMHMGDDCVRHLTAKLQSAFEEGLMFRMSGGEFLAILPNFTLEKLVARLEEMEDEIVSCRRYSIATGYAWDNIENELPQLIQQAFQSMKFNKQQHFDSANLSSYEDRQKMVQELLETLDNREFEVFLQPKINLFTGKLMGAEALVRYRKKDNSIVAPSHFIDVLEKNNLIRFVDFFVFEECCRLLEKWQSQDKTLPIISFNFSRLTLLERNIATSVQAIFDKHTAPKEKLEIEITESVADLGKGVLYQAAHELYQAGYAISLDDFGTKYTNLDILSEVDFDMLKVDKSLVNLLTKRRSNQIILQNIITMCKHLNISVIAEGIETKAQESVLRSLGCRYGQGYLYGRPMPISEFEEKFMAD